jgi:hypothetical protein
MPVKPDLRHALPLLLASAFALTGCGESSTSQGSAGGQVLPGSASDAMLPLDTVRSQPPLAKNASDEHASGKAADGKPEAAKQAGGAPADAPVDAPAPDAPAAQPPPQDEPVRPDAE